MVRIASSMINTAALNDLQRSQFELFEAQRKTASQREAEDLKGYGRDAKSLVSLQRMRAKSEGHLQTAQELNIRLELQDTHLGRAADSVAYLRDQLTTALALNDLSSVSETLEDVFSDIKGAFNATHNGQYLFGGTNTADAPIQASDLNDLATNPLADAVTADGELIKVRIDDNRLVNAGPLGRTEALGALSALRDLEVFAQGPNGPFTETPDQNQKDAVKTALNQLSTVYGDLIQSQAANGRSMNEADAMIERHISQNNVLDKLTGDLTEVDLAEVAVQLNQAQVQFQATASVFRTIQSLSLVDFLR